MNNLFRSIISVPCPTCSAAAGQHCDMITFPQWEAHGVLSPFHGTRFHVRPIARTRKRKRIETSEQYQQRLEKMKQKRRAENWRVA